VAPRAPRKPPKPANADKPTTKTPPKSEHVRATRERYLEQALDDLEAQRANAEADGSWTAAVQAKRAALAVRADLDALRERRRAMTAEWPSDPGERREALAQAAREMRVSAAESGSFVAATQLLRLEADIVKGIEPEPEPELDMTPEEVIAEAVEDLSTLPADMLDRILEALGR
jgi:hypothetical protein